MQSSEQIFILDDCHELRALVVYLLKTRFGCPCGSFASYDEMVARKDIALNTKVAVLDINLGNCRTGIDAYQWLKDHRYRGRILFFTGHARNHPDLIEASRLGFQVLEKPVSTKVLLDTLSRALNEMFHEHS